MMGELSTMLMEKVQNLVLQKLIIICQILVQKL